MVEESWGETFRELRESKNLSLSKVSGDYKNSPNYITSKVQLSRFERNESDITLTKISKLVEKLGITFEEYLSYVRDFEQSEASNFIDELQRLTELGNYEEIENLYEKSIQNFSKMNQKKSIIGIVWKLKLYLRQIISKITKLLKMKLKKLLIISFLY